MPADVFQSLLPGHVKRTHADAYREPVEGKVLRSLSSVTQAMTVVIAGFDGGRHEFGPMPWMPRVEPVTEPDGMLVCRVVFPVAGDRALIVFEGEGHDPWVSCWWPASSERTTV